MDIFRRGYPDYQTLVPYLPLAKTNLPSEHPFPSLMKLLALRSSVFFIPSQFLTSFNMHTDDSSIMLISQFLAVAISEELLLRNSITSFHDHTLESVTNLNLKNPAVLWLTELPRATALYN